MSESIEDYDGPGMIVTTGQEPKSRGRAFCFTLNNYTQENITALRELVHPDQGCITKYVVFQYEIGERCGTPHLQGFVQLLQSAPVKHWAQIKQLLKCSHVHVEKTKGTAAQAAAYCKKSRTQDPAHSAQPYEEYGDAPKTKRKQGEMEQERWSDAFQAAVEGRDEDIPGDIRLRQYNTIKRIKRDHEKIPERLEEMNFHLFYGQTQSGKSHAARVENPEAYIKGLNKWFDGYENQDTIIVEEIDPTFCRSYGHLLKQWCDVWPFSCEMKGDTRRIRPAKIIFTSNYDFEELFGGDIDGLLEPMRRRLKITQFNIIDGERTRTQIN